MTSFLVLLSLVAYPRYSDAFTTISKTFHCRSQCQEFQHCSDDCTTTAPLHLNLRLYETRITTFSTTLYANALNKQEQKKKKKKADLSELYASISPVQIESPIIESQLELDDDQKQNSLVWKARLLLLLSACLYGSNYTCIKILGDYIPSEIGLGPALRFATAALATVPFLMNQYVSNSADASSSIINKNDQNEKIVQGSRDSTFKFNVPTGADVASFIKSYGVLFAGFEVAVWNTVGYLSQARGLESTPASTCAFICSLTVVVVPILDFLAGKNILK